MTFNALRSAEHLQKTLIREGFIWPDKSYYLRKVSEELSEVEISSDRVESLSEIGDLLLACTALASAYGVDASEALTHAIRKFGARYAVWRELRGESDHTPNSSEGRHLWDESKQRSTLPEAKVKPMSGPVAIIGSWDEADTHILSVGREVGRTLGRLGVVLVSGGGPGLMAEATLGAHEVGGLTVGVLGTEDPVSEGTLAETGLLIPSGLGWDMRSSLMMRMVKAVIVIGGAVGTLQEITMAYMKKTPIIVMECGSTLEDRLKDFCIDGVWIDHRKLIPLQFCSNIRDLERIIEGLP